MKFQRNPSRRLPNGEIAVVYPFHICTKGEKVVFKSSEDLRVAFNYLPICALRSNVIIVTQCVLNTHFHSVILSRTYEDAKKFVECYKQSVSMYLSRKYGPGLEYFREVESKPIFLDTDRYVRNAICYVIANALDTGVTVDAYPWSGYRAFFQGGKLEEKTSKVSAMTKREVREILRADIRLKDVQWLIDEDNVIIPSSYCDCRYVESAFYNDASFFTKVLGLTDRDQMDMELVTEPLRKKSVEELIKEIESRSQQRFGLSLSSLSPVQKVPILKAINYSTNVSVKTLSRCFELAEEEVSAILKRK